MKTPTAFRPSAQGCPRPAGYPGNARFLCPQPQRGCVFPSPLARRNPVGVGGHFVARTQGSRFAPTLGWRTLPRWGNARHDRLVGLVDKLLALVPKLRASASDAERATLQNAVTATDQQIDALVYDLYGLTADEIKLVESGEKP